MYKRFCLLVFIFALAYTLEAQPKLNELTRSNMSFKKSFSTEAYEGNDKAYRDSDKRFNTNNFYDSNKSYYDQDKRFNTNSYYDQDKRARGYSDIYNTPELNTIDGKSRFYDNNKELFFNNKDQNLNKDYTGRSDFSKTKSMEDMVDRVYEDLMDRSMSDINKYHSQTSRQDSTEGGIPIAPTSQREEESSILDLLDFSNKKIDNPTMNFSLPRSMSHMRTMPADSPSPAPQSNSPYASYPSQNSQAPAPQKSSPKNPNIPDFSKGQQAQQQNSQSSSDAKKIYTVDRPVKEDDAEKSIFGVPKQFNSGKVQISVEVKQK